LSNKNLALKISVANPVAGLKVSEVYDELEKVLPRADSYRLDSSKVSAAAIEFLTVLYVTGSVTSIAGLLWYVYDSKIRPKKAKGNDCGLYIAIDPERGLHWHLGKDFNKKTAFVDDFTLRVDRFLASDRSGEVYAKAKYELSLGVWIRR
jgi:hypothetical protein